MTVQVRKILVYVIIVAATVGLFIKMSGMKQPPKQFQPDQTGIWVHVEKVGLDTIATAVEIDGPIKAAQRIDLFTEVSGKMLPGNKPFKDGVAFQQGEVLLSIDKRDYELQAVAARSGFQRLLTQVLVDLKIDYPDTYQIVDDYVNTLNPKQNLAPFPAIADAKARKFLIARNVMNQYYAIEAQQAQLAKFTVIAPFDGVLSGVDLDAGRVVQPGQRLGQLIGNGEFELEAGLPLSELSLVKRGAPVKLTTSNGRSQFYGKVKRIGAQVDRQSQTVKVAVSVSGDQLFDGMYLQGEIQCNAQQDALEIPRYLLQDDNQLFVVQDSVLKLHPVELMHTQGKQVIVKGLTPGMLMVNQIVPGAFEGMKVQPKL